METRELQSVLEALLFVAGEPVAIGRLVETTATAPDEVEAALSVLADRYRETGSGLRILTHADMVEMVTSPETASQVEEFFRMTMQEGLSRAALETLSVVAYRGPVSRAEIEAIRGVNCQFSLRNLALRGLVDRREEESGRGYLYEVSFAFLEHLGLERVSDLPDYAALSSDERLRPVETEAASAEPDLSVA